MDNSSSIQANSALPDPEKEKFEQEEQRKYEEWKTQQEGGEATEQADIVPEAAAKPTTTADAVKGGAGDHSWGGHEEQQKAQYGLQKPANVSQEDWDARPEWSRGLENIVAAGSIPALGVADFLADAAALVPFLKPVNEWWDENSPRSNHPAHKAIREAASIIIPTMYGGGAVTGSLRAATAARSIPKATRILGTIGAHAGVDTAVTAISSHSKEQDNIAAALNEWLGWDIPWATRDGDSPDVIRKKNIYESAGLSVGVDLITSAFSLSKAMKVIPGDEAAERALARHATGFEGEDPISFGVLSRRSSRTKAQRDEAVSRLIRDPRGDRGYDPFINTPDLGPQSRAVTELEPNPIKAKIDNWRIQNNVGTVNGRARPFVSNRFIQRMADANPSQRAEAYRNLFDKDISANVGAKIDGTVIPPDEINKAVTQLYNNVFNPDIKLSQMESIVNDMKTGFFNKQNYMGQQEWRIVNEAFIKSFEQVYNPKVMRASAVVTNQAAGTIADTASAIGLIGDVAMTGRQQEIIVEKLKLLSREVRANQYISNKVGEYKQLAGAQNPAALKAWIMDQNTDFARGLKAVQDKGEEFYQTLEEIAKNNPEYLKPLALAMEATNGEVDQIYKLNRWAEENVGFLKKAFYDGNPQVPSLIVKGLHSVRYNHILSGLAPLRALTGNSMLAAFKPATVLAGAKITGDTATFQKALWTYGGIQENFNRAYKVMGDEWRLAKSRPEEAMMRGRADLRQAKMDNFEALEAMAGVWRSEGNNGKVAMWNIAKGLSWYNNNPFVRWGINAMYAIDGFTNSLMASGSARAKAYNILMKETKGGFSREAFDKLQKRLYSQAFDHTGLLTDKAAKHASQEIALNLDSQLANDLNTMLEKVPAAKSLFLFPRTGLNALNLSWTFTPGSGLIPLQTKVRKVFTASNKQEIAEVLMDHGLENSDEAFRTLKSEYIGRQLMGATVVTGAGMWALQGNLTGNGPQNAGERKRMISMGWEPNSIKNPITGEWHSYKGFEPFDSLLGLVGDAVYFSNRVDQSLTEQLYQKIAFSISMNVANKTFLSGMEPLVSMFSGDEGAFNRFLVNQADSLIPFAPSGMRSVLNQAISPQLKDVENDWGSLMANKWKFMSPPGLVDQLDIYTGKPIRFHEPLTAAANAFMPFGKSNGDMEPWRQWLISTGWDNVQSMRINPITKELLSPEDRHWINNWIAKNMNLAGQIESMMNSEDGFWTRKMKEYKRDRGLKKQKDYPLKELVVHQELSRIHRNAMKYACSALERYHSQYSQVGLQNTRIKNALRQGNMPAALEANETKEELRRLLDF